MAAICSTVFSLPIQLAAITTPRSAAIARSPVTAISRAMITIATQACRRFERDERDERGGDQQLVGERVHQLAEGGDRVARAGEITIEAVGKRGEGEDGGGQLVPVRRLAEQGDDDDRHRKDAQQGQRVGQIEREHPGRRA